MRELKFIPSLDKDFKPFILEYNNYCDWAKAQNQGYVDVCVERSQGCNYTFSLPISNENKEDCFRNVERMVKAILWIAGGHTIYVKGSDWVYEKLKETYSPSGARAFDFNFMQTCYLKPLDVIKVDELPKEKHSPYKLGGHVNGCRIGFDAGGSDFKVSAVVDGQTVYSEEIVWNPKEQTDPDYHYEKIAEGLKKAGSKMERVDAIGVSSAGVIIDNKLMVSSLFVGVDKTKYLDKAQKAFVNVIESVYPNVPYAVANDGDITALAGSMSLNLTGVMGMAMGTSQAVGYINKEGDINGWISELAFCPVDLRENGPQDEWSGDIGVGCKYFSQDAVIRLAEAGGYVFKEGTTKAERLSEIQRNLESGDKLAKEIYENIGIFLGYTLPFYHMFYGMEHLLLMGRVISGSAGQIVVDVANNVLKEEFPELNINIILPDEKAKRVGQSIAAASLVQVK